MRHILNILRFALYIPLCLGLLYLIYLAIAYLAIWLSGLSLFWLIIITFFGFAFFLGAGMWIFGFLAAILSYVNPYKKIGGWVVIPLAIIYAFFNLYVLWKASDLSQSQQLIVAIVTTALIFYINIAFSICISASNPKELLSDK